MDEPARVNPRHSTISVSFLESLIILVAAAQFTLLSKAKEMLANPESRAKYDKWRRSGIAMSYEDWCGLRGAVHTVSKQKSMIE